MTPFEQHALAGRIAAQDHLIGLLLGVVVAAGTIPAADLAKLIEEAAANASAGGRPAEAAYLKQRAQALRR